MTKSEARKRALVYAKQTARLVRLGVIDSQRIGFRTQASVLSAYRRHRDPIQVLRDKTQPLVKLLRDGMVVSYLVGLQRQTGQRIVAAGSPYTETRRALQRHLKMDRVTLVELEKLYGVTATRVVATATASVEHKLQEAITGLVERGAHVREGVQGLSAAFEAAGMTPRNSFTYEAIFRTQTQIAYNAGAWNANQDPAIREILWGYQYSAIGDARTRPSHAALDGMILPVDHELWQTHFPPNGWACRCQAIEIFRESKIVIPPDSVVYKGKEVRVGPDEGFAYNPANLLRAVA